MSRLEELFVELCPDGVPFKPLGELGTFYSGLTGKTKDDFNEGDSKFITYMNVYTNMDLKTNVTEKVKISENEKQNILYAWYAPLYRQGDRPNVQHWTMLQRNSNFS